MTSNLNITGIYKMKKLLLLVVITVLISISGLGQSNKTQSKNSTSKKVNISGTVISKNTNEFLPNAKLSVRKFSIDPIELRDAENHKLKTDPNGRWVLKNIEAGEYRIVISPPERNSSTIGRLGKLAQVIKMIDLNDDLTNLIIKLPQESIISGTISLKNESDDAGDVYIIATDSEQHIVSGTEIKDNRFTIENLSEGSFKLNLNSDNGYFVKSISLNGKDVSSSSIKLKDGQTVQNIKITLSNEVGYLTGKLKATNATERIMVFILPVKEDVEDALRESMPTFPDENGVFEFTAKPGEYLISTLKVSDLDKKTDNNKQWFEIVTKNAQKVIILPTQTTNVDLEFKN